MVALQEVLMETVMAALGKVPIPHFVYLVRYQLGVLRDVPGSNMSQVQTLSSVFTYLCYLLTNGAMRWVWVFPLGLSSWFLEEVSPDVCVWLIRNSISLSGLSCSTDLPASSLTFMNFWTLASLCGALCLFQSLLSFCSFPFPHHQIKQSKSIIRIIGSPSSFNFWVKTAGKWLFISLASKFSHLPTFWKWFSQENNWIKNGGGC